MKGHKIKRGFATFLTAMLLAVVLLLRPRPVATITAHATCQKLVAALRSGDMKQVKALTTPGGFADLQKAKGDPRFGSFTKLADRISGEWLYGKPLESISFDRGSTRVWNDPSTWMRKPLPPMESEGMSMGSNPNVGIMFRRTPQGCKVDRYKITPDNIYFPHHHAVQMQEQANAYFSKHPSP